MLDNEKKEIGYITRKGNDWYYEEKIKISNLDTFLTENPQFIQISAYLIINLNLVKEYFFESKTGYVVVSNIVFSISRRYLSQTRAKLKEFHKQKIISMEFNLNENASFVKKNIEKLNFILANSQMITFIKREGSVSTIHFKDGSVRRFYEPLTYFENLFTSNNFLLRIERNHLVNIRFVDKFRANTQNKTATINIDAQEFHVSRRRLALFRDRYKSIKTLISNKNQLIVNS